MLGTFTELICTLLRVVEGKGFAQEACGLLEVVLPSTEHAVRKGDEHEHVLLGVQCKHAIQRRGIKRPNRPQHAAPEKGKSAVVHDQPGHSTAVPACAGAAPQCVIGWGLAVFLLGAAGTHVAACCGA